jgi:hypothetical protein
MTAAANKEALSMHAPIQITFEGVLRSDAITISLKSSHSWRMLTRR